ncbi:BgTH12-05720 [Blumeria graminis f. sp. triticale]|uniref:Kinesin-like protein n=3 Tax=Blumeria graminis TaxID=34373 RepID=A0A061HHL4_BLUGR|nr:Kinesin-related motor protein [Blumeria graminis f. sp. tritici 96224]CAD6503979.1 BgTH12-05720 [Blumeria graminis f. sp. triticale]VDB90709.1 Bgt-15 [Blumeria graminis f. sp. tritici]
MTTTTSHSSQSQNTSPVSSSPISLKNSKHPVNTPVASVSERRSSTPILSKSGIRPPASTSLSNSSGTISEKHKSNTSINVGPRIIKKQISINAFPYPPSGLRTPALPLSPLGGGSTSCNSFNTARTSRTGSSDSTNTENARLQNGKCNSPKRIIKHNNSAGTLSMNSDNDSNYSGPRPRKSGYRLSQTSSTQSRSSSTLDSYPTSLITPDQANEFDRGRDRPDSVSDSTMPKSSELKGNVLVSVRVRPDPSASNSNKTDGEWMVDGKRALVSYRAGEGGDYYYDNVFTAHDNNSRVYDSSAKRLVRRVMEGYHGTVFAYGMTGTGKTFSMQGTASSPGVIPLAITDIFSYIRETPSREFLLRVSYLEIYNEKIHDLLSPPSGNGAGSIQQEEIKLREDSKRGVYASSLKEEIVQSPTQLLRVIARGDQARRTSSTQFNSRSSRSHAVVQIVVESRERIPGAGSLGETKRSAVLPGGVRVSTLSLIDLAGSERAAETKERRTEGSHINKSLLTLGTVIAKLSGDKDKDGKPTDKDGKHLPYRDSKLTRLLQGALSGNSLVSILCTIQIGVSGSAAASTTHAGETLNTLKFASRAKNNIISHAKKADDSHGAGVDGSSRVLLERYRMEILELRSQLEAQAKSKVDDDERVREKEAEQRHEEQMLEMHLARTALKERIEHLNRLILSSKSTGVNLSGPYYPQGLNQRLSLISGTSHNSIISSRSRSSLTPSTVVRNTLERTSSQNSVSTVGQRTSQVAPSKRLSHDSIEDDESIGEFADGNASLAAQNRALQADLADKTRYCQTLEKRLIQARRSSMSRASSGVSSAGKSLTAAGDHNLATLVRERDTEIAELKARLEDKDRMLSALRNIHRTREHPDKESFSSNPNTDETVNSVYKDTSIGEYTFPLSQSSQNGVSSMRSSLTSGPLPHIRKRNKSVDEMSRILDEMIQDRVETGHLAKNVRGAGRIIDQRKPSITSELLSA